MLKYTENIIPWFNSLNGAEQMIVLAVFTIICIMIVGAFLWGLLSN